MLTRLLGLLLCGGLLLASGCARGEEGAAEEGEMEEAPAMAPAQLPDTAGAALWTYLQNADYRNNWKLWPGKGKLYMGREPHGALLTTYINETAGTALMDKAGSMPAAAIIVKENYMPDSTLAAITVMYKVPGYDPGNNNWFWAKFGPAGEVQVEGRGQGCIACHGAERANDFVFTGSLSQ